jgi:hypothetical protein
MPEVEFPPCRFHAFVSFTGAWTPAFIADTDRLDFLQVYGVEIHLHPSTETATVVDDADGTVAGPTLRDAIDGAMRSMAEVHGIVKPLPEG